MTSLRQEEFLLTAVNQSLVFKVVFDFEQIPHKMQHEYLCRFFPVRAFDCGQISPIQVVGITEYIFASHYLFTAIVILTVVNYVRLYH